MGVGIIGLQLDRTPASGDRLVKLALLAESQTKLEVSHAIIRFQRDGLAVGRHRLVESTRSSKVQSEVVVGVAIIRLQLDGAPASGDRLIKVALLAEEHTRDRSEPCYNRPSSRWPGGRRRPPRPAARRRPGRLPRLHRTPGLSGRSATATVKNRMASSCCGGWQSPSAIPRSWLIQKSAGKACWARRRSARAAALAPRWRRPISRTNNASGGCTAVSTSRASFSIAWRSFFSRAERTPCRQGSESARASTCLSQAASGAFSELARINQWSRAARRVARTRGGRRASARAASLRCHRIPVQAICSESLFILLARMIDDKMVVLRRPPGEGGWPRGSRARQRRPAVRPACAASL